MEFDPFGHLIPYEVIETDLATVEAVFVTVFANSQNRPSIFEGYLRYVARLDSTFGTGYYQWLGGSFITLKPEPRDLDVVTFLDYRLYEQHSSAIWQFKQDRFQRNKRIDGYIVPVYPKGHRKRNLFEANEIQWRFDFGRNLERYRNGILQLNF